MSTLTQRLFLSLISLCLVSLPACAKDLLLSSPAIEGKVTEVGSRNPIPGAIVAGFWQGHVGYSGTVCYHVETATTDTAGRFVLPGWEKSSPYGDAPRSETRRMLISVYKPGYETTNYAKGRFYRREDGKYVVTLNDKPNEPKVVNSLKEAQMAVGINDRYLKPFTGTRGERLEYLSRLHGATGCGAQDDTEKNRVPFLKALYQEALPLAQTEEEKRKVESILYDLEIRELGFEKAQKRYLERAQEK